jgi:hypothetical protein
VKNTYHRGLDELRSHKVRPHHQIIHSLKIFLFSELINFFVGGHIQVNFDDLTEVARINKHKVIKTFTEPEGLWAYVVLIRYDTLQNFEERYSSSFVKHH